MISFSNLAKNGSKVLFSCTIVIFFLTSTIFIFDTTCLFVCLSLISPVYSQLCHGSDTIWMATAIPSYMPMYSEFIMSTLYIEGIVVSITPLRECCSYEYIGLSMPLINQWHGLIWNLTHFVSCPWQMKVHLVLWAQMMYCTAAILFLHFQGARHG